ncbi:winged helix-turn-helix domain-containing protein [Actinopolymorpha sp. B17G11]|uniref:ArsR/SmtB family transcription factor n=1 Tax=unclassified Actinopolymorpha TaxID=2627063 RepID=UPI0032D93AAA
MSHHVDVLKIHFTAADVARTRVASAPDPLWELVLSLHVLQSRRSPARHQRWRAQVARQVGERGIAAEVRRLLFPLAPVATYFPDFLTPGEAAEGVDAGIDAVVSTPSATMAEQFAIMASRTAVPGWAKKLAAGDRAMRHSLGRALRSYYDVALAPSMEPLSVCIDADRAVRTQSLADGGVNGLLASLWPLARWQEPTLLAAYPRELTVRLDGRGLVLIPSYFCDRFPVALVDSDMQPVLVYPAAAYGTALAPAVVPTQAGALTRPAGWSQEALENLLGATRAAVLLAIGDGRPTKRLASHVGVSPATISHHTAVLREAGLIASRRVVNTVVHTLTPLGAHLLGRRGP